MKKSDNSSFSTYQPTIVTLRYMLKYVAYCGIFPNTVHSTTRARPDAPPNQEYIGGSRQNFLSTWNKFCIVIYSSLELLQIASFIHYIMTSEVKSPTVLETLFWLYLTGTCFIAFAIWNFSGSHDPAIKLMNEWAAVEQDIFGSRIRFYYTLFLFLIRFFRHLFAWCRQAGFLLGRQNREITVNSNLEGISWVSLVRLE